VTEPFTWYSQAAEKSKKCLTGNIVFIAYRLTWKSGSDCVSVAGSTEVGKHRPNGHFTLASIVSDSE